MSKVQAESEFVKRRKQQIEKQSKLNEQLDELRKAHNKTPKEKKAKTPVNSLDRLLRFLKKEKRETKKLLEIASRRDVPFFQMKVNLIDQVIEEVHRLKGEENDKP